MFKPIAIIGTSLLLFGSPMSPVFAADRAVHSRQVEQLNLENQREECRHLADQFDNTKTSNAEAKSLRDKGWDNCFNSQEDGPTTGLGQLTQALKLIGVEPTAM